MMSLKNLEDRGEVRGGDMSTGVGLNVSLDWDFSRPTFPGCLSLDSERKLGRWLSPQPEASKVREKKEDLGIEGVG